MLRLLFVLLLLRIGALWCPRGTHGLWRSIHRPIGALAGVVLWPRNFPEAFVQGQIVSDGVLPSSACSAVVRESVAYPGIDVI